MLVLTIKAGDGVQFTLPDGRDCRLVIQEARAGRASVSLDIPPDLIVLRQEVVNRTKVEERPVLIQQIRERVSSRHPMPALPPTLET